VQQTRLAKQKQLRRGCIQSRLRSDFTMPEAGGSVQFKKSMLRIGGKWRRMQGLSRGRIANDRG
jgi:hypothetical protein